MVEAVERLRQAERVLRQHRQLERPHRLIDDVVEARGFEHQAPEIVRLVVVGDEHRPATVASAAATAASSRPIASFSLVKMLLARTTAYWRYGPLSPSKLSASSMSKTMTLPRENLTMK